MNEGILEVVICPEGLRLEWLEQAQLLSEQSKLFQTALFRDFSAESYDWLLRLAFKHSELQLSETLSFWHHFAFNFVQKLIHQEDLEHQRDKTVVILEKREAQEIIALSPLCVGIEYLSYNLLMTLWSELNKTFCTLIKTYDGTVEEFFHSYNPKLHLSGRVFFHLVESKNDDAPFAFLATYSTHVSEAGVSKHLPLKHALREFEGDNEKLLELLGTVYRAARESSLLADMLESGEIFHPLAWGADEAFAFLKEVHNFEMAGVLCRIPNWWTLKSPGATLDISVGNSEPTFVGMDTILSCKPGLSIDGVKVTREEAEALLNETDGLALIKNKWVTVDKEKLQQTLEAYENASKLLGKKGLTFRDALRLQISPEKFLGEKNSQVELGVSYGKWLKHVNARLSNPELVKPVLPTKSFRANLRPYQHAGLNWLMLLDGLGFGGCLADDMGLGKTIQVLAFLNVKSPQSMTSLLVVPASLISNWSSEIERFCPELTYFIAHPSGSSSSNKIELSNKEIASYELVITTYAMAQRYEFIKDFNWDYIILDEAQAIKNPGTKQTRAIKTIQAKNRLILSGTPVENRLADLWSLFDFLNPGLLGTLKEFQAFSKKLKDNTSGYGQLRKVISPYILRRLKTDKSVIQDLPDKVEMKSYAQLGKKQTVLYRQLLKELENTIENTEGIARRGLILASLMKFKQLCNHPDQFLGLASYEEAHSGKFKRLREICETIFEKREKVLIFTQFREITIALKHFLSSIFFCDGLVLDGSVAVKKRKAIVERFQSSETYIPFMVLSLKAGGVGLNLTEASHVIHFDRWWNPAVENQATDRAFRIGQKKNVVVHKFITQGTIEEKIDDMLEEKSRITDLVITSGAEKMITEMPDEQLLDLFRLRL